MDESLAYDERAGHKIAAAARKSLASALLPIPTMPEWYPITTERFWKADDKAIEGETTAEQAMTWAQHEAESVPRERSSVKIDRVGKGA